MQIDMADPSDMPELHEDAAAPGVNGIRDFSPARNLLCRVDAGGVLIALRLLGHLGRLCDDEAGTRALGVIERTELGRYVAGTGAAASYRRHRDAILEGERADLDRGEEIGDFGGIAFLH